MNSTFKVVFNKARGALMVVNEVTSSVQGKGTKTVVAAAVATMLAGVAGTAMAAEWVEAPEDAATVAPSDWKFDKNAYLFNETNDGNAPTAFLGASEKDKTFTFDKKLWVKAGSDATRATGLWAADGATIENTGTIYVTGGSSWKNHAMGAANGAKAINAGTIVAKNAYGMFIGTSKNGTETPTIQNDGRIVVEGQGAGFELGGVGVKGIGINNGTITVGEVFDKAEDKWAHGVLINTATNTFENNGTINATAEGTSAIEVKDGATTTTLNFGEKSDVNGLIHLAAGTVNMTFNGTQDELTIKTEQQANYGNSSNPTSCAPLAVNLTLDKGANITLADRQGSTYESVNIADGKLTASIWHDTNEYGEKKEQLQNDNKFKNVTVGEKGVFNITKLNSGGDKDQTKTNAKPHDKLLIKDMNLTLEGGDLQVAGKTYTDKIVIGTSNTQDSLMIQSGSYVFADVNFGSGFKSQKASKLNVNGGELTVGQLDFSNGEVTVAGQLTADKLVWTDKKYGKTPTSSKAVGSLTVTNGGTLTTVAKDNLGKKNEAGHWVKTDAGNHLAVTEGGILELTDVFSAKAADVKQHIADAKTAFGAQAEIVFKNVTLTDEEVKWDADLGTGGLNTVVKAPEADAKGAVTLNTAGKNVAVAGVQLTEGSKTVQVTGDGSLTVRGDTASGKIFDGVAEVEKAEFVNLSLGYEAKNAGVVNAKTLTAANLDVIGNFTAQNVEVNRAYVDGSLALNSLKVADQGVAEIDKGTLHLLGVTDKDAKEIAGKVAVTDSGLLTTNLAAAQAHIAKLEDEKHPAILYVDRALKLADGAEVVIGTAPATQKIALFAAGEAAAPAAKKASVTIAKDGYALVDVSDFIGTKTSVFGDNTDINVTNSALDLINVNKTGEVKLGASLTIGEKGELNTDSIYVSVAEKGVAANTGVVTLAYNKGLVADATVDARLENAFTNGVGAKELGILSALDTPAFYDEETDKLTAAGNKALEQATGGNATAGVLNVAYDANAQVTDAIVRHQLSEHTGMGVWADVFYAKNEAKEIYGDFGYSADIYGGVLGFDYTAACGGTFGAALTVGTADADSEGGALSNSLSSDFVGLSVYASKDFSGLNVKADLGYIDFSNDFTGLGDASDATTITFGVRGDFTAYQNGAFSVVPHMGLRYTRIDTDAVAFNDEQNMNVLEAPIGVKFAGTFEATGWKLVPSYDFTIVPQLGDKEVEAFGTASDITILSGGLFNNVLGVEAVKDNMSFGLNASYGFGPDDRANTQVNANFRYNF